MKYNFDNERPIYIQLVEKLKIEIVSNNLKSGDKLPSVREYANLVKVNPNTMQKALSELEKENLIYTKRTNGKYVTTDKNLIDKIKDELAVDLVNKFINDMNDIGIDYMTTIKYLKKERDN